MSSVPLSSASLSSASSFLRLAELRLGDVGSLPAVLFSRLDSAFEATSNTATRSASTTKAASSPEDEELLHLKLFVDGEVFSGSCDVGPSSLRRVGDALDLAPEVVKTMTLEALRTSANDQFIYDLRRNAQAAEGAGGEERMDEARPREFVC